MKTRNAMYKLLVVTLLGAGMLAVAIAGQAASHKSLKLTPQLVPESSPKIYSYSRPRRIGLSRPVEFSR